MKFLIPLLLLLSSPRPEASGASINIENETLNVEGSYQQRQLTPSERLKRMRAKLEKQNEILVKKQIEMIRYRQEVLLLKRMQKAFKQGLDKIN
jgi:hypothetical protein